jgi:hypothetical protein
VTNKNSLSILAVLAALTIAGWLGTTGSLAQSASPQTYLNDITITSKRAVTDFVPTGDLSKDVWKGVPRVKYDVEVRANKPFADSETQAASVWTPEYLYLAYRCRYRALNVFEGEDIAKERFGLWYRDTAEAFINPTPEVFTHYYEFEVAPNNQWVDLEIDLTKKPFGNVHWDSHFEHATRIDEKHHIWMAEMKIPVKSMGVSEITPGAVWRINLYRLDGHGDDPQRRFLAWAPLPPGENRSFHQPASFGMIKFVN